MHRVSLLLVLLVASGCPGPRTTSAVDPTVRRAKPRLPTAATRRAPMHFLKGQTHLHTGESKDSGTPVDEVIRQYETWGFDFIVITDHNVVTEAPPELATSMVVIPGVELTRNPLDCEPPPEPGVKKCLVHTNALFVTPPRNGEIPWPPKEGSKKVLDLYQRQLDVTWALGGLAQLNHPNFNWTASNPELIGELVRRGVTLLEIANEGMPRSNPGDDTHRSVEQLWDDVLTAGHVVWGVASDDAHHYDDAEEVSAEGRHAYRGNLGWIMVHAQPDAASIREAMAAGDFYSSNGVELTRVEMVDGGLEVESLTPVTIVFIGAGGRELSRSHARSARFDLSDVEAGYVRAVVIDDAGRKAWTQPAFVD